MPARSTLSRRTFTGLAGAATAGFFSSGGAGSGRAEGPNEKLNLAAVGVGGQGRINLRKFKGQNIVAVCDVDERRAGKRFAEFDAAGRFTDFRRMFDAIEKDIDGVIVSTPDHTHFHPAW